VGAWSSRGGPRGGLGGLGLQGAESRAGSPKGLSLNIHDAGEPGREPLQVDQAYLVVKALGFSQEDRRGALRGKGLEARARGRETIQDRAVSQ
jgi:hypothetical protein